MLTATAGLFLALMAEAPIRAEVLPFREHIVWKTADANWKRELLGPNGKDRYTLELRAVGPLEGGVWAVRIGLTRVEDPYDDLLADSRDRDCLPFIESDQILSLGSRKPHCRQRMALRARKPHDITVGVSKVTVHSEPDASQCAGCESIRSVELDLTAQAGQPQRTRRPTNSRASAAVTGGGGAAKESRLRKP